LTNNTGFRDGKKFQHLYLNQSLLATYNTMAKGQTTIYKTLHGKLKTKQHEPH